MKEEYKSLFSIAHDHFQGMMVAQMIKEGGQPIPGFSDTPEGKAKYVVHFYNIELANHFYIEEYILQPLVRGFSAEIDKIFDEIIDEHKLIENLVESLKDGDGLSIKLNNLGKALEAHIKKEEQVLFPKIQETLSVFELENLAKKLRDNGYEYIYRY